MNTTWKAFRLAALYVIAAATTTHALHAEAGGKAFVVNDPAYRQECGSCPLADPPPPLSGGPGGARICGPRAHFRARPGPGPPGVTAVPPSRPTARPPIPPS